MTNVLTSFFSETYNLIPWKADFPGIDKALANYHVSLLQVLQSEQVIRTRSLINQSFKMSEVTEIFSSVSNLAKNRIRC